MRDKFGILPEQYADFKSLTGDSSDNIRGAEKIGVKSAAALINQFGSLKSIIRNANEIAKPHIRESIKASCSHLEKNYELIKLRNNYTLEVCINTLSYESSNLITRDVLKGIGVYE